MFYRGSIWAQRNEETAESEPRLESKPLPSPPTSYSRKLEAPLQRLVQGHTSESSRDWTQHLSFQSSCFHSDIPCICGMLPGGSDSVFLQCGRPAFDPWVGTILWRREWQPTPVFLPGKTHGQRSSDRLQSIGSQRVGYD